MRLTPRPRASTGCAPCSALAPPACSLSRLTGASPLPRLPPEKQEESKAPPKGRARPPQGQGKAPPRARQGPPKGKARPWGPCRETGPRPVRVGSGSGSVRGRGSVDIAVQVVAHLPPDVLVVRARVAFVCGGEMRRLTLVRWSVPPLSSLFCCKENSRACRRGINPTTHSTTHRR